MPRLFTENPTRSALSIMVALLIGHFFTKLLTSTHALHITQTSVAILALTGLMFLVAQHHRREGHLMTQTQEEVVLIVGLALFWIAVLLAWKGAYQRPYGEIDLAAASKVSSSGAASNAINTAGGGWVDPYPCTADDYYCLVEEYTFF
ncbi:hypothetical protein BDN72DRAFT_831336 [Pluteus cervinus]|uniref:Uncharacterized protein n=1 Tax=Pluteus cervinus TaxID=181527 RepID=A0ACD3BCK3_9AGAR|nr:hypothetical protein BDN72DRAFT_831336 [Pluteus cervinus]